MLPETTAGLVYLLFKGGLYQGDNQYLKVIANDLGVSFPDPNDHLHIYIANIGTAITLNPDIATQLSLVHKGIETLIGMIKDQVKWTVCGDLDHQQLKQIRDLPAVSSPGLAREAMSSDKAGSD
jgi:hypothetical protein